MPAREPLRPVAPAPARRSARREAALLLAALAGAPAGCARDKGAVVVRWRIVDSATGRDAGMDRCPIDAADRGACCADVYGGQSGQHHVIIDRLELRLQQLGQPVATACPSCCFTCLPAERTTQFELPPGDYRLWLEALRCGMRIGDSPPAVVRRVTAGEVTNLNAVEILLHNDSPSIARCESEAGMAAAPTCPGDVTPVFDAASSD